ncbi:hypothetical protein EV361DRAFT_812900, partial [Lentinula raphanica]
ARIPSALAALHNFIMDHDPEEHIAEDLIDPIPGAHLDPIDMLPNQGDLMVGQRTEADSEAGYQRREQIAQAMWDQYVMVQNQRSLEEELRID